MKMEVGDSGVAWVFCARGQNMKSAPLATRALQPLPKCYTYIWAHYFYVSCILYRIH